MSQFNSSISSDRLKKRGLIFTINHIVREVEAEAGLNTISARARAVLRLIGEMNASGSAPRLVDIAVGCDLGSPPTIYATLRELEKGGWIVRHPDDNDARAWRLYVTARSEQAFARMSELVRTGSPCWSRVPELVEEAGGDRP